MTEILTPLTIAELQRDKAVDDARALFGQMIDRAVAIAYFDLTHDLTHEAAALFGVTGSNALMWAIEKLYTTSKNVAKFESTEVTHVG